MNITSFGNQSDGFFLIEPFLDTCYRKPDLSCDNFTRRICSLQDR